MKRWERPLLYVALLVAAGFIAYQAGDRAKLRDAYAALMERQRWPHPGYVVPAFEARTLDGEPIEVGGAAEGERQLLLFFRTTCPYCRASLPAWTEIATSLQAEEQSKVRVLGVALDEDQAAVRTYRDQYGLRFQVITFPNEKLRRWYRAGLVPLVLLLDSEGAVLYARPGVLESSQARDSVLAAVRGEGETLASPRERG
jgi:thiol-disulfide isomerase/thioredoxin